MKELCLVAQSCSALCNPIDCSAPGSSVQARILEWVALPFSTGSSNPGIKLRSPTLQADSLPSSHQKRTLLPGKPCVLCPPLSKPSAFTSKSLSQRVGQEYHSLLWGSFTSEVSYLDKELRHETQHSLVSPIPNCTYHTPTVLPLTHIQIIA